MNLIAAVKSGYRFRRKAWLEAAGWHTVSGGEIVDDLGAYYPVDADDLLADDWEIEPPTPVLCMSESPHPTLSIHVCSKLSPGDWYLNHQGARCLFCGEPL